jgi:fused signal recognition particle receptor
MGFFDRISEGLSRSRDKFKEQINVLLDRGPDLDEDFWDGLEETLILSDIGGSASCDIVENLREQATRKALPDAYAVLDMLYEQVANTFTPAEKDIFDDDSALVLFVGINGTGKTTTVGKIAKKETDAGRTVILGSADTFRAAAIEQLEVWAQRAQVEMVTRERGSDPASVCYDTIERAETIGADLVLIDTAGRLHTSSDLMRELEKVVNVVRKRSSYPVYTVLVIDATTGQNGLHQAREFNKSLDLDGLIITKLDGTAKGGIALAVSHELELPIFKIGVGEGIDDLRPFDAMDFAKALLGDFDERQEESDEETEELHAPTSVELDESQEPFIPAVEDKAGELEPNQQEPNQQESVQQEPELENLNEDDGCQVPDTDDTHKAELTEALEQPETTELDTPDEDDGYQDEFDEETDGEELAEEADVASEIEEEEEKPKKRSWFSRLFE